MTFVKFHMPFNIFFVLYFFLNNGYSFIIIQDLTSRYTHYYVTSSKIRDSRQEIDRKLQKGSISFNLSLEPDGIFEIWIRETIPSIVDRRTKFQSLSEKETVTLKNNQLRKILNIVVEGFVTVKSYSSSVVGYILNTHFYGTIDLSETTFTIESIQKYPKLFGTYKTTSYNAVVYKTNKYTKDYFKSYLMKPLKAKRNIKSTEDSYKLLLGKG